MKEDGVVGIFYILYLALSFWTAYRESPRWSMPTLALLQSPKLKIWLFAYQRIAGYMCTQRVFSSKLRCGGLPILITQRKVGRASCQSGAFVPEDETRGGIGTDIKRSGYSISAMGWTPQAP